MGWIILGIVFLALSKSGQDELVPVRRREDPAEALPPQPTGLEDRVPSARAKGTRRLLKNAVQLPLDPRARAAAKKRQQAGKTRP